MLKPAMVGKDIMAAQCVYRFVEEIAVTLIFLIPFMDFRTVIVSWQTD